MKYRRFTQDLKRSLIEQLLSETVGPAELCRRYNLSSGQLYTWKRQYAAGRLNAEPSREAELAQSETCLTFYADINYRKF